MFCAFQYIAQNGIRPLMFKLMIGKGHPEFSTAKQQDAEEFLTHFLQKIEEDSPKGAQSPVNAFKFMVRGFIN